MHAAGVQAVILPSADPHQSEYVPDRFKSRAYFSGFTGSAGTAVVTLDGGGVWTDSRYYVSARAELARTSGLPMMPSLQGGAEYIDWLAEELPADGTVGIDGRLFTVDQVRDMQRRFDAKGLALRTDVDLVDGAWEDRAPLPSSTLFSHDVAYAGRSAGDKVADLRAALAKAGLTHTFLTALDEIAWLLNVRASDIEANPLALAYLLVGQDDLTLFTDGTRVDAATQKRFDESRITVEPYAAHEGALTAFATNQRIGDANADRIGIDEAQVNYYLAELIPAGQRTHFASPVRLAKAIKNDTEIGHIRRAHAKDGVALVRAFRWLEHELRLRKVRECEFVEVLREERAKEDGYYGDSFAAIVAYGANAALPHYHSVPGADAEIEPNGILLVDSGGQYVDGTTDITRTFGLGKVSDEQRTRYTLVLKGMIALSQAVFPVGTRGIQLDTLARQYLWQQGLDFGHGTGHGVGFFLNVHEPPQGFAPGLGERGKTPFAAGMLTSNEPGYYQEGAYGIRIENLVLAVPAFEEDEVEEGSGFLRFETVTYYPIDMLLVEPDLLTVEERAWLSAYHAEVYKRLSPGLDKAERKWLKVRCEGW